MSINMYRGSILLLSALLVLYLPIFPFGFWLNPPTGSMQPQYDGCDINFYGPGEPQVGDVMMYWAEDDTMIMHRVIENKANGYKFKGDNIPRPDDGIIEEQNITSELYGNIDVPVSRDTCRKIFRKPYNAYYSLVGSDNSLEEASVKDFSAKD